MSEKSPMLSYYTVIWTIKDIFTGNYIRLNIYYSLYGNYK